ncbi:hypothetical protein [Leptospira meyeri]|uniref:hypothetical protein n=1 Tax=Leptospira meyeri TaxID=29508 RepID=UPI000C299332|nr:hypothetical protein [Leptospira meyeri]
MDNILKIKRNLKNEWIQGFPELSAFGQDKFYKIVGCLVVGIEAVNIPNIKGYKPHFVIYPLWKRSIKECLNIPSIYLCINKSNGLQYSIPYLKHSDLVLGAISCARNQIPLSFIGDIKLSSLLTFTESIFSDPLIKSNSAEQAKLFELKIYMSLYLSNQGIIRNILSEIQKVRENWNMRLFEIRYGNYDIWFNKMLEVSSNREAIISQIEINKEDRKIKPLVLSEIIE